CPCVNCENVRYHTIETWYCGSSIYGYPEKAYQKNKSWYCGSLSSSFDGEDKETISAMEEERRKREEDRGRDCDSKGGREQEKIFFLHVPSSGENDKSYKESEGDENGTCDKESESD
ncbi:hypothetical protein H5410_061810, partial [Solanum commersonii]